MINWLASRWQRPERGWDPVPSAYAHAYSEGEWQQLDDGLIERIERWTGPLAGRRVLDLGGGPGQFSVAFARRGALVTWHDISRIYESIARRHAVEHGVAQRIAYSIGYLEDAPLLLREPFDLVFNRVCWNYGRSDAGLARAIHALLRPGGWAYVDATIAPFRAETLGAGARLRTALNAHTGIKIGHPLPPRGRVASLLLAFEPAQAFIDYGSPWNDRVLVQRAAAT